MADDEGTLADVSSSVALSQVHILWLVPSLAHVSVQASDSPNDSQSVRPFLLMRSTATYQTTSLQQSTSWPRVLLQNLLP